MIGSRPVGNLKVFLPEQEQIYVCPRLMQGRSIHSVSRGWAPWDTEPGPGRWGPRDQCRLMRGAMQAPLQLEIDVALGDGVPRAKWHKIREGHSFFLNSLVHGVPVPNMGYWE